MSSSSEICASVAASKSSRAIPNDTEKAKSLPSAPSASVEVDIWNDDDDECEDAEGDEEWERAVTHLEVEDCLCRCYLMPPKLAWQMEGIELCVRRLPVSARGSVRGQQGGRVRRAGKVVSKTVGSVFGCSMGNLLTYGRGHKHPLRVARSRLERVSEPVLEALARITGPDRVHLNRGTGLHRVVGTLGTKLPEVQQSCCLPITDKRRGAARAAVGVAYGLVLAVLGAFAILSAVPQDEELLEPLLEPACREMRAALEQWDTVVETDAASLNAERRAAERALAGVRLARQRAREWMLSPAESVKLQLSLYRRAAWPAGERIGPDEQASLLARLQSGALVGEQIDARAEPQLPQTMPTPGVLPLAALAFAPRPAGDDDASSVFSQSTGSWGSWASESSAGSSSSKSVEAASLRTLGIQDMIGKMDHLPLGEARSQP